MATGTRFQQWMKGRQAAWQRFWAQERGANLVLFGALLLGLLGVAGLAIDGSNLYYQQQRMQIAADAAALGGARKLAANADYAAVNSEIQQLAFANAADGVEWEYINNQRGVHVTASRTIETYFARVYGRDSFYIEADAKAQYEPVSGVDGLFPVTLDCDCITDDDVVPVDGGGGGSAPAPTPTPVSQFPDPDPVTAPISGTVELDDRQDSTYSIEFVGRSGNTWTYRVDERNGKDLSHWLLGIDTCLDKIVSSSPSGAEIGVDGSTGVNGIKWNVSDTFTSGTFAFTLNGDYPAGGVNALAKAGTDFGTAVIRGPVCDGTNTGGGSTGGGSGTVNICLPTLDFETDAAGAALVAGQVIDTEWAAWGVRFTSQNPSTYPAMIFNTAGPTGNDPDLGTPNADFGGPGTGAGGRAGKPGQNSTQLGKVLIVSESNNSANPDDRAAGGTLIATFDYPVRLDEVQIIDIDDAAAAGMVRAYSDAAGTTLVATGRMLGLGDNSVQTVVVEGRSVRRLEIVFPASGGVASITSCRNSTQATYRIGDFIWADDNANGLQDSGEAGIPGVTLELYVAGESYVVAQTTTNATGYYLFDRLPPGSYEVKVAASNFAAGGPLAGTVYTSGGGSDATRNSDFNSATGAAAVTLTSADNLTIDGGFQLPATVTPGPQSTVISLRDNKNSTYSIALVGVSGNTWTYRVRELAGRDLSHWNLGIVNCLDKIVGYSPTSGFASGTDGSTGFVGVKWDVASSFRDATFSITLREAYQMGTVEALAKAGTANARMPIAGPDCSAPATGTPPPSGDPVTPPPTGDTGGDTGGGDDDDACSFNWLDWNGGSASNLELKDDMDDTGRSGVWQMGQVIPPGPSVGYSSLVATALNARVGDTVKIPLTHYNGTGYAICGFANVRLLDYNLEDGNSWINLQFLRTLVHGVTTDPNGSDYGARDVRFKQ